MTALHFLPTDDILLSVCELRTFVRRDAMTFTGNFPNAYTIKPDEQNASYCLLFLLLKMSKSENQRKLISPPIVLYVLIILHSFKESKIKGFAYM